MMISTESCPERASSVKACVHHYFNNPPSCQVGGRDVSGRLAFHELGSRRGLASLQFGSGRRSRDQAEITESGHAEKCRLGPDRTAL